MVEVPDSAEVVDAFHKAGGVLAARARGDLADAEELMLAFDDVETMASGFLLVAQVAVEAIAALQGRPVDAVIQDLNVDFERVLRSEGG